MAFDRQGAGLLLLRLLLGAFFLFEGLSQIRMLVNPSLMALQLANWRHGVVAGSMSARYLDSVLIPRAAILARLVPVGEIGCGLAMCAGVWTPLFAFLALFMTLSFHVASGTLFTHGFLTSGYGLPLVGGTLALSVGGVRLPLSLRR